MDTFDVKLEKRNAILKHRQLSKMANLLRFVEVFVVLVVISRFTTQLPVAVKNSGEYFRGLSVVLVSPRFVFIVGNVIVITLFAKAGQFSAQDSSSGTDLYEEFVEKSEKSQAIHRYEIENREKQKKKTTTVEETKNIVSHNVHTSKGTKNYRRSQSENLKKVNFNKSCQQQQQLRRSESEKYRKDDGSDDQKMVKYSSYPKDGLSNEQFRNAESEKYRKDNGSDYQKMVKYSSYPEDGLSNEQFRNAVEAFIARQKKLLREEEYSVILKDLE